MENIGEVVLKKVKANGLVISRLPEPCRSEFKEFAEKEFADDYGMALRELWEHYKLMRYIVTNFDAKLDNILEAISNLELNEKKPSKEIKLLDGRTVQTERRSK